MEQEGLMIDLYAIFYDVMDNIYYALLAVVVCVTIYELIIIQYFHDERVARKKVDSLRRINLLELPEGKDGTLQQEGMGDDPGEGEGTGPLESDRDL